MKLLVTVTIFVVCLTPISASFFDQFRGAIVSVHQSFGRLFSDVVTDVSDTIGCTILAVKQVLSLDGTYHESSDYNKKCRDRTSAPNTAYSSPTNEKAEKAIIDINEHNAQEEITNIEFELKKQTDRLMSISNLLKRELDNIPNDIRIQFKDMDPDPNESTVGHIWRDLKILHGIEHSQEKIPQINEIHEVLNEALQIMQINDTNPNVSDDEKIKEIVLGLEKETNDTIIDVEDQFQKWEKEEDTKEKREINTLTGIKEENSKAEKVENTTEMDRINTISEVETQLEKWENEEDTEAREVISAVEHTFSEWDNEEETKMNSEIKSTATNDAQKNDLPSIVEEYASIAFPQDEKASNNEPVKATTLPPVTSTPTTSTPTTSTPTTITPTTSTPATSTPTTSTPTTSTPTTITSTMSIPTTTTPTTSTPTTITPTTSTPTTSTPTTSTPTTSTPSTPTTITSTTSTPTTITPSTSTPTTSTPTTSTPTTSTPTTITSTTSIPTTRTPTTSTPTTTTPTTSIITTSAQTTSTSTTTEPEFEQFQQYVLSQLGPQDAKSREEAVQEAEKLVQDSEYRNTIFNYLKNTEDSGANLFENPELFNFGS